VSSRVNRFESHSLEDLMNLNIAKEVTALGRLSTHDLRAQHAALFGDGAWATNNRVWLIKRIAWRLQAQAEGDLSERARLRAAELANEADLRLGPPRSPLPRPEPKPRAEPKPKAPAAQRVPAPRPPARRSWGARPGTTLARVYKGERLQVQVLENGFAFEGVLYRSLSSVAKTITGSHCSGVRFFGLERKGATP
jgi:hypothetical protein